MTKLRVSLACGDYDRTRPLIEGKVNISGIDLDVTVLPSGERHSRFMRNVEFDVCELQIAQYLGLKSRGAPITAIPVFPHRRFNHSCVMVRSDANIGRPEDLRGRRVGVHGHFNPIALWVRGVLQHDFDLPPSDIHWVADGTEEIPGWSPPPWLKLDRAPHRRKIFELLACGDIDAQIVSDSGADLRENNTVRRLWPNYRRVEQDYYRRTGIFPIRHVVAVRNDILAREPELTRQLVRAFEEAKQHAYSYWSDHRRSSLAWFGAEQEEEREILGPDPWPYSVAANRIVLETLLNYAFEQALTERRLCLEELFAPNTLDL